MPNYGYYNNPYMTIIPSNSYGYLQQPMVQQPVATPPQQVYTAPMQSNVIPVDGEIGAKAYMVPSGSQGPIALWDTNDNVIYMRTFNAAGMPNPLKKLRYVEEEIVQNLPSGQSGSNNIDTSQFVTKQDLEDLRQEIRNMSMNNSGGKSSSNSYSNNQNGNQNQNRNMNNGR